MNKSQFLRGYTLGYHRDRWDLLLAESKENLDFREVKTNLHDLLWHHI